MEEIWKDIEGYDGLYQISNKGKVRSLDRFVWNHNGYAPKKGEFLVSRANATGHHTVNLSKNGKSKMFFVHRLVAFAFIPNPDNLSIINHKDENPSNNCVENLEWCTCEYNINYGTARKRSSLNHSKNRPVCMFDVNGDFIREFYNINDAAKFVNGVHTCILRCCRNEVFCYKGYIWRYKEDIDSIGEAVTAYKNSKTTNRKVEVDIDGQKEVFNSISEASRALGISRRTIRRYNSKNNIKWELI